MPQAANPDVENRGVKSSTEPGQWARHCLRSYILHFFQPPSRLEDQDCDNQGRDYGDHIDMAAPARRLGEKAHSQLASHTNG
jgi:hypothetical protein